jgi:hypothetical protein
MHVWKKPPASSVSYRIIVFSRLFLVNFVIMLWQLFQKTSIFFYFSSWVRFTFLFAAKLIPAKESDQNCQDSSELNTIILPV